MKDRIQVFGDEQITILAPQSKHLTPQLAFSPLQHRGVLRIKSDAFSIDFHGKISFLKSSKLKTAPQSRQMWALDTQWQYGMATASH